MNPSTQMHIYLFSWYKGMHLPVFLQGELSQEDCRKKGMLDHLSRVLIKAAPSQLNVMMVKRSEQSLIFLSLRVSTYSTLGAL